MMKVLIACEFSGIVRDAFILRGHDAVSCDLEPSESPGPHIQGDVTAVLRQPFDLVIAHPPCTYLCNSGVRWLKGNEERWGLMREAAAFFNLCLAANAPQTKHTQPVSYTHLTLPTKA